MRRDSKSKVARRRDAATDRADERPYQLTTDASSHPRRRTSAFAPTVTAIRRLVG